MNAFFWIVFGWVICGLISIPITGRVLKYNQGRVGDSDLGFALIVSIFGPIELFVAGLMLFVSWCSKREKKESRTYDLLSRIVSGKS